MFWESRFPEISTSNSLRSSGHGKIRCSEAELEDDFFASLGMSDEQPAASQGDQFGQWEDQAQGEAEPLEDDFLTSLGMSDEQPVASQGEA